MQSRPMFKQRKNSDFEADLVDLRNKGPKDLFTMYSAAQK